MSLIYIYIYIYCKYQLTITEVSFEKKKCLRVKFTIFVGNIYNCVVKLKKETKTNAMNK